MSIDPVVHVAVCADRHILPGLHVTLSTTLRHLASNRILAVHLLHHGLSNADLACLRETLNQANRSYTFQALPVELDALDGLSGIRGNVMAWARFFLPAWLPALDRVLYLDSDLAVLTDVAEAYDHNMNGYAAALADPEQSQMRTAIERPLFESLSFDLDAPYYNTGVLLMDLVAWRSGIAEEGLSFARQQGGHLGAADQTAINAIFYGIPLACLPARFNRVLYAADPFPEEYGTVEDPDSAVYHFLGAPKPWDFMGEWIYRHSPIFQSALAHTALAGWRSYSPPSVASIRVAVRNAKSYIRALRSRR